MSRVIVALIAVAVLFGTSSFVLGWGGWCGYGFTGNLGYGCCGGMAGYGPRWYCSFDASNRPPCCPPGTLGFARSHTVLGAVAGRSAVRIR